MGIFVKDSGLKVEFRAESGKGAVEYGCEVEAFTAKLAEIGEESPKHAYMGEVFAKNGRIVIKSSNKYAKVLRSMAKVELAKVESVEDASELSIEDAMAEAEARNEAMSKAARIKRSNLKAEDKAMLLELIGA